MITCIAWYNLNFHLTSASCSYLEVDDEGLLEVEPCTDWDFDNSTFLSTLTSEVRVRKILGENLIYLWLINLVVVINWDNIENYML